MRRKRAEEFPGRSTLRFSRADFAMAHIELDRQFFPWGEGEFSDPDVVLQLGRSADLLTWGKISARRRVVIMAEAGSGKTAEMREQARLRKEAGQFAFYATVEDVGEDGLENSLEFERSDALGVLAR